MQSSESSPRVGIFWGIVEAGRSILLADHVPHEIAEQYGEALTRGAHHEHWKRLAAL